MMRKMGQLVAFSVAAVAAFVVAGGIGSAQEKKVSIKDVMKTAPGKMGLCAKTVAAAKDGNWDEAVKLSKSLKKCVEYLPSNEPPKGSADSWKTLTAKWIEQAAAVGEAAEKKDVAAVEKAGKAFSTACGACHKEHQVKK